MIYSWPNWTASTFCLITIASLYLQSSIAQRDLIYDELVAMNATCGYLDSCRRARPTNDMRVVNCQCGPICAQLGTCCADSKYRFRGRNKQISATKLHRNTQVVFMVNECKPNWNGDSSIKDLCDVTTSHAYFNDPFLLIPVTNIRSGVTYRNYYCFACNEDNSSDTPVLWELHLFSDPQRNLGSIQDLRFDERNLDYTTNGGSIFYSTVGVPEKLSRYLNWYRQDVISTCDGRWTDLATKRKCSAYTALVYFCSDGYDLPIYKNPHCAICNYRSLSDRCCSEPAGRWVRGGPPYGFLLSGIFSFEDKVSRCPRNEVFDNFSKKCRAFRCGRNQKVEDGKCESAR